MALVLTTDSPGGAVTHAFISPNLWPSRSITPYVRGWFEKLGGQLYVNRGIGTIGLPIRRVVPLETARFELVRPYGQRRTSGAGQHTRWPSRTGALVAYSGLH